MAVWVQNNGACGRFQRACEIGQTRRISGPEGPGHRGDYRSLPIYSRPMRAVDIIMKKRDGHALERDEIGAFVQGVTAGTLPDYQASALLMAILLRGMTPQETAWLTDAMVHSGIAVNLDDLP